MPLSIEYRGHRYAALQDLGTIAPEGYTPSDMPFKWLECGRVYRHAGLEMVYLGFDWDSRQHAFASPDIGTDNQMTFPMDSLEGIEQTDLWAESALPANADLKPYKVAHMLYEGTSFYNVLTHEIVWREEADEDLGDSADYETCGYLDWNSVKEPMDYYKGVLQLPSSAANDETVSMEDMVNRIVSEPGWGVATEVRIKAAENVAKRRGLYDVNLLQTFKDCQGIEWRASLVQSGHAYEVWCCTAHGTAPYIAFGGPNQFTNSFKTYDAAVAGAMALAASVAQHDNGGFVEQAVESYCRKTLVFGEALFPSGYSEWKESCLKAQAEMRAPERPLMEIAGEVARDQPEKEPRLGSPRTSDELNAMSAFTSAPEDGRTQDLSRDGDEIEQ